MLDPQWQTFQLRRQSDELIYTFIWTMNATGDFAFKRQDGDYWITWQKDWGWVAWDDTSQSCMGRPWLVLPQDQGDHPPEGEWVSRKGPKSYVYSLAYVP